MSDTVERAPLADKPTYPRLRAEAESADGIFASFSKSGRTWVRFTLEHYLSLKSGAPFSAKSRNAEGFAACRKLFFTEDYFDFFLDEPGTPFVVHEPEMRERLLVVLVRDPRDTIISSFHWNVFHRKVLPPTTDLTEFVNSDVYGIERMSAFVRQLLAVYRRHQGPKHLLNYEDCWREPGVEFERLVRFLDGDAFSQDLLESAVALAAFDNMQKQEIEISRANDTKTINRIGVKDWDGNLSALKVRKGGIGGFLEEAPWLADCSAYPETVALIDELSQIRRLPFSPA